MMRYTSEAKQARLTRQININQDAMASVRRDIHPEYWHRQGKKVNFKSKAYQARQSTMESMAKLQDKTNTLVLKLNRLRVA
jgi:hypothetical protein